MTVVSLALGVAGLAAISLIAPSSRYEGDQIALWILWLASLLATTVAYAGTMTGAIVLPPRIPALVDLLLPLLLGTSEFAFFAILAYQATGLSSVRAVLTAWWFAFGGFGLLAAASIWRATYVIGSSHYESALEPAIDRYLNAQRRDRIAATAIGLMGLVGGVLHAVLGRMPVVVNCLMAVLVIIALGNGLNSVRVSAKNLRAIFTETPL